jgi:hypothetical protein
MATILDAPRSSPPPVPAARGKNPYVRGLVVVLLLALSIGFAALLILAGMSSGLEPD